MNEGRAWFDPRLDAWTLGGHDDVAAALGDPITFSSAGSVHACEGDLPPETRAVLARGYPGMPVLVNVDPPLHTEIRKLATSALATLSLADIEQRVAAISNDLVDSFAGDGEVDFVEGYAWHLPLLVLGEILRVPRSDLPVLRRRTDDWLDLFRRGQQVPEQLAHARSLVELQQYFARRLRRRRRSNGQDLMSLLERARLRTGRLTLRESLGVVLDLMVAGHRTITRALSSSLVLLLKEPARARAFMAGGGPARRLLEESLRLEPPTWGVFRMTTAETRFGTTSIPSRSRVVLHLRSANRDSQRFTDPDAFAPERAHLARHLSFGRGIHYCVGAQLARVELRVGLSVLLRRLPDVHLKSGGRVAVDPTRLAGGFEHVDIAWKPGPQSW